MRGFDTQGSIFIDGIRDLGTVTRDTFNTEQVEVAKGPAGPDYGRGAASGYVNLASKVPGIGDFSAGSASYGTANNARITGDLNHRVRRHRHRVPAEPHGPGRRRRRPRLHRAPGLGLRALAGLRPRGRYARVLLSTAHRAGQHPRRRCLDHRPGRLLQPGVRSEPAAGRFTSGCECGRGARAGRQREFLRLRQRLRRDQGHDVHGPLRARFQRQRHAAQHHALRQVAPVLRAHRRECAHGDRSEPRRVDRRAHAPGQVPGKHAAHQPDQYRLECEHGRHRPRDHGRLRVHRRRAVQPDLRRARHARPRPMSTTRTATMR